MIFLADINIFLEILLGQDKVRDCKSLLDKNIEYLHIVDSSLYSISKAMIRYSKEVSFRNFAEDVFPVPMLLSLPA